MHPYAPTDPERDSIPRRCCRTLAPIFIIEMFDLRRNAASDFDPEIQLIPNSNITCKLQRHHFRTGIIIDDAADQESPIVRTAVAHHLLPLVSFHVCCCEIPIKHLRQMIAIIIVDRRIFFSKIVIDRLPVRADNGRNILRTFHPALDLQRIYPCVEQLWNQVNGIQIARREQKVSGRIAEHISSCCIDQCIRKAAGLRTAAAIPTAPADHAAHQTLS